MKESNIKKLLVGVVVVCFIILLIILVPFRRNVEDGKVKRNISLDIFGNVLLVNNKEPIGRTVAWNSELPYFVERDLEYALENNYEIEYCIFKSYSSIKATINIVRKDNEWTLTIKSPYSNLYNDYNELTNFSIYNDSNNNIIVYGYGHRFNEFIKYSVGQTELDYVTLTYDCNLPLDMEYESIRSYNMGEYSLVQKDNEFLFYKNGEFISSTVFPYQEISHSNIYDSFIINSEQKLYMIYAKLENKKPKLDFIYVGNADEQIETGWEKLYTNYSEDLPSMPIFKKNNEYYVPVPDNWNIYKDLFATKRDFRDITKICNIKLVKLADVFSSADFSYDPLMNYGEWNINVKFVLNGKIFNINYNFDGYDDDIILPDSISKKFTRKVNSLDELWNNIEEIRKVYFDYCSHKGS